MTDRIPTIQLLVPYSATNETIHRCSGSWNASCLRTCLEVVGTVGFRASCKQDLQKTQAFAKYGF